MAGIYIHVPFCKSRCIYCGFYSTTALSLRQRYIDAVCIEWEMRKHELAEPVDTIYLGGGTPSQLAAEQLAQLFSILPATASEVTIECNPDDVTAEYAGALALLPVNRVSMGVQTFDDRRLQFLNRRHTAAQVQQAVDNLRRAGITNISADLMYGFPDESLEAWQDDIRQMLALDVAHLSAYCLMVEEGTALQRMGVSPCDEETERQMYDTLIDQLTAAGYEHYEISNFARRGCRSRHNSSYWHDIPYIGLGAAAHSYIGSHRQWNTSDIHQYIAAIEQGRRCFEQELIDEDTHYNDCITVALRTSDGLDLSVLPPRYQDYCKREARRFLSDGLLQLNGQRLSLTRKGLFISDYIMSSLIIA